MSPRAQVLRIFLKKGPIYIVVYEYVCYENVDLQIYFVISSCQQNMDTSHYIIPIKFLLINYVARAIKKNYHWCKPRYSSNNFFSPQLYNALT